MRAFIDNGGNLEHVETLLRTLNGMPTAVSKVLLKPGTVEHDAFRAWKTGVAWWKIGKLTKSAIPNVPEVLGNTLAFGGAGRLIRATGRVALNFRDLAIETARDGARTSESINWNIDPARKMESITRIGREVIGRVTLAKYVNEFNEFLSAVSGRIMSEDLQRGNGTAADRERLAIMKFAPKEIDALMSGKAPAELYHAVKTRFAEVTQGSTSFSSERSAAGTSRAYQNLIAFDAYAQMKVDRTSRVNERWFSGLKSKDPVRAAAATKVAAEYYLGTAASGAASGFLRAVAAGGIGGAAIWLNQELHDPAHFALESLRNALIGGPLEALVRTSVDDDRQKFYEPLIEAVTPVSILQEGWDFFQGHGRYKDRDLAEKAAVLLNSTVPLAPTVATWAAAAGGKLDPAQQAAISAYWKWRRANMAQTSAEQTGASTDPTIAKQEAAHREFRIYMRRAFDAMKAGQDPKAFIIAAAKAEDPGKAAESIRSRMLLPDLTMTQRDSLRASIGDDAYHRIQTFDAVMGGYGAALRNAAKNANIGPHALKAKR